MKPGKEPPRNNRPNTSWNSQMLGVVENSRLEIPNAMGIREIAQKAHSSVVQIIIPRVEPALGPQ